MPRKFRIAIVGAGWIAQEAFMPAVSQTGNAEMTAIVSGNRAGAEKLAAFYGVPHVYGYDQYEAMLAAGVADAVYIALPNSLHVDFAIRAAKAGLHAIVEKPLAVSIAESEAMIAAAAAAKVKLMTAYRLHSDPGTHKLLDLIRSGAIGSLRHFESTFGFQAAATNHRLKAQHWGGPLQDLGVYCINAARYCFGAEPVAVSASRSHGDNDMRFTEVEESVTATLHFAQGQTAQFHVSFGCSDVDRLRVVGTTGYIEVENAYRFEQERRITVDRGGVCETFDIEVCDDFSGQIAYFADCCLNDVAVEPDGAEGLADMLVMLAIEKAATSGRREIVEVARRERFITPDMMRRFPPSQRQLLLG